MRTCLSILLIVAALPLIADDVSNVPLAEEITVTAKRDQPIAEQRVSVSKTDTPLRDLPQSVQVVPREVLSKQGARDVNDSITNVSSVTQSSSSNYGFFNNYMVRGLQQTFLRDGLADGATVNGYPRTLTGVERIEVLKGPGSAIYGSSAPGGTINVVLRAPSASPSYDLTQTLGSFGHRNTTFGLTGPIGTQNVIYRLDAGYVRSDGDRGLENRTLEVLPRFTITAASNDVISIDAGFQSFNVVADTIGIPLRGTSFIDVPRELRYYTPFGNTEQKVRRASLRNDFLVSSNFSVRAGASHLSRALSLLRNAGGSIAATSAVMTRRSLRSQDDDVRESLVQIEPMFATTLGATNHVVLAGVEMQHHDIATARSTAALPNIANIFDPAVPETSIDGLTFAPNFDRDLTQRQTSMYVQDQMELGSRWKLRVGGRWDSFNTHDIDVVTKSNMRRKDSGVSGQAGAVYQPVPALSIFGGVSRGQLAILSTESATSARQPESSTQVELGAKVSPLGGRLFVNVAAFRVTRENFLVTIDGEPQPVGEQQTRGFEIDVIGTVSRNLHVAANYALQDAVLVRVPGAQSVDGNRATGVPRQSAGAWLTYELSRGLRLGSGVTYRGSIFTDQLNTIVLPAYFVADAMAGWRYRRFDIQLNVRNLADRRYFRNALNSGAFPGEPRNVSVNLRIGG